MYKQGNMDKFQEAIRMGLKGKNQKGQLRAIKWSDPKPITTENLPKVPDASGIYALLKNGKVIYVGVSKDDKASGLRHRLQSYNEKDDYSVHKTKQALRHAHPTTFKYQVMNIRDARKLESQMKQNTKYNADVKHK